MTPQIVELRSALQIRRETYEPLKQAFLAATHADRPALLEQIVAARDLLLKDLLERFEDQAAANIHVQRATASVQRYAHGSDWNFVDVVLLALCLPRHDPDLPVRIASASLSFHALRMVDDVIDQHMSYKDAYPTMLGELTGDKDLASAAPVLTLLWALVLLCEGLTRCPSINDGLQRTIVGALHESVVTNAAAEYDAMVQGKMVSYGHVLYRPVVDSIEANPRERVIRFLRSSFRIGQLENDLLDCEADRERRQPNFWHIHGDRAADRLALELDELAEQAITLPEPYHQYGSARVCDLAGYGVHVIDRVLERQQILETT